MSESNALTPIAGGTDLLVSWPHSPKEDLTLLDVSCVRELAGMQLTDEVLELGGLTTYWDVITAPKVANAFPLLVQAAMQVGAIQIQTRGTWAGNIANGSPAADGVLVLMAYGAEVVLTSSRDEMRVPINQYFTGYKESVRRPDQLISKIIVPVESRTLEWFHKVGARSAQAITKVGVAMVRNADGWRVAVNSVAPFVCRCQHLEEELNQGTVFKRPEDIQDILSKDISPIDDIRSTAEYRSHVLSRLIYFKLSEI